MASGGGTTIDAPSSTPPPSSPADVDVAVGMRGVRKTYGDVVAVDNLYMTVNAGEFFTLLGPSGSGKTTTLRVIAGLEPAASGSAEPHGADATRSPPYQRPVNTAFQDCALFPHLRGI